MAPSAALIISCAALAAVVFQASISWAPIAPAPSASVKLNSNTNVATGNDLASVKLNSTTSLATGNNTSVSASTVYHSRTTLPTGWEYVGPVDPSTPISFRMMLKSKDSAGLRQALINMSTPGHPDYGKHLNKEQVGQYMSPLDASGTTPTDFFGASGVYSHPLGGFGDQHIVGGFAGDVSTVFNMEGLGNFRHVPTGTTQIRAMSYVAPSQVAALDATTFYPPTPQPSPAYLPKTYRRSWASRDSKTSCRKRITPACVQQAYGLPTGQATASTSSNNAITVTGYAGSWPQDDDLQSFLQRFRPDMNASTSFVLQTTDSGSDPQSATAAGSEANLDTQYTIGLATGVPVEFLSVGNDVGDGGLGGLLDTVNYLASNDITTTVLTTSFNMDEDAISPQVAEKLCDAYAALGALGVSVIFSSGDGGVGGEQRNNECREFVPTFPSTCPYVTTVGATTGVPETAAMLSAGGFSNYFARPDYQSDAVDAYLSGLGDTYAGLFNASGRAYPDVAAYGWDVQIYNGGQVEPMVGTSCSAPMLAATVALLNEQRLAAGQSSLGFLNPWLYANPGALNDITWGSNPGCSTDGFNATVGWDPVTGLGSPNFPALAQVLDV